MFSLQDAALRDHPWVTSHWGVVFQWLLDIKRKKKQLTVQSRISNYWEWASHAEREGEEGGLWVPTCKQLQGHEISHRLLASSSSISCPYFFSTISSPCSIIWLKEQLQNRKRQIPMELVWEKLAYCWSLRNFLKDSKLSHKSPLSLWQIGGSRWQAGI